MKTLLVPTFEPTCKGYRFLKYKEVKVKNKPNSKDYIKVTNALPGLPVGYCSELYKITETAKPIEIIRFYDLRQQGTKQLKGFFIRLKS